MHSNPAVCVSIGFVVEGVPVIGVVYAPCTDELFVAVKGCGAFLNGQKINVSRCQRIRNAIVVCIIRLPFLFRKLGVISHSCC